MIEWGGWGGQPRLLKVPILQEEMTNRGCSKSLDSLLCPPVPHFSFRLLLSWMPLPVSEAMTGSGEAQAAVRRPGSCARLIIRPWAHGSPAPGSWLPSFTSSFLWRPSNSYRAERLLHARHSPYICDKTDMVLPSGFLQLREGDVAKEMTGHHTIRATRENDSAL